MQRREFVLASLAGLTVARPAGAQPASWPQRPLRVIIPYAAGGGPDVVMRNLGPLIGNALSQSVVLENKVGAGGVVAAQYVAQQAADGYTLLMGSNTHLIQKALQPSLKFDPMRGFVHICSMFASPNVMVVAADSPFGSVEDVIAAVKARPGKFNYSSGGVGTAGHLAGATFAALAGLDMVHVPLRGSVDIMASLLRGDTAFSFPTAGTGIPQAKSGKLRALAVTSRKRLNELQEVRTLHEIMKQDAAIQESWFGLWAPVGTPEHVASRVFAAVKSGLSDPAVTAKLESAGNLLLLANSVPEYADFVRTENEKWSRLVRLTKLRVG